MIAKNVRQRLSNIQQSYDGHMDLMIQELDELERLARIGRATEKAYSKGAFLISDVVENYDGSIDRYNYDGTIEELLGWLEFTESEE